MNLFHCSKNLQVLIPGILFVICYSSCKSSQGSAGNTTKPLPPPVLSDQLMQKQLNGVDFFATGSKPASWTLEMDFGKIIRFKSLDGPDVNSSAVNPVQQGDGSLVTYTTKATNGEMIIEVSAGTCKDVLSGTSYDKIVVVKVNDKRYEGCGQYLFDKTLDGKWILQKINGREVSLSDFSKGLPELNFELARNKLSGHDGCNTISSSFEILGSKIKFTPFAGTKMACPGIKTENQFQHLLSNQTVDYYFKDGLLYFYLPDDSIIIFRKA